MIHCIPFFRRAPKFSKMSFYSRRGAHGPNQPSAPQRACRLVAVGPEHMEGGTHHCDSWTMEIMHAKKRISPGCIEVSSLKPCSPPGCPAAAEQQVNHNESNPSQMIWLCSNTDVQLQCSSPRTHPSSRRSSSCRHKYHFRRDFLSATSKVCPGCCCSYCYLRASLLITVKIRFQSSQLVCLCNLAILHCHCHGNRAI